MLGGTCKTVTGIRMKNLLPLNDMGRVVAEEYYVGTTLDDFNKQNASGSQNLAVAMGRALPLYAACKSWNLKPKALKLDSRPVITDVEVVYPQWDMTVPAGNLIGFTMSVRLETEEGITWARESTYKHINPDKESVATHWYVEGEPGLHVVVDDICGEITTASTAVNRIPDVIAAKEGLITYVDLGTLPKYHAHSFEIKEYPEKEHMLSQNHEAYDYQCCLNCRLCPFPGAKCKREERSDKQFDFENMPSDDFVILNSGK